MSDTKRLTMEDIKSITGVENKGGNMSNEKKLEERLNEALALLDKYKTVVESMRRIIARVVEDADTAVDNSVDCDDQYDYLTTSWDDEDDEEAEQQKV